LLPTLSANGAPPLDPNPNPIKPGYEYICWDPEYTEESSGILTSLMLDMKCFAKEKAHHAKVLCEILTNHEYPIEKKDIGMLFPYLIFLVAVVWAFMVVVKLAFRKKKTPSPIDRANDTAKPIGNIAFLIAGILIYSLLAFNYLPRVFDAQQVFGGQVVRFLGLLRYLVDIGVLFILLKLLKTRTIP